MFPYFDVLKFEDLNGIVDVFYSPLTLVQAVIPLQSFIDANKNNKYRYIICKSSCLKNAATKATNANPQLMVLIPLFRNFEYYYNGATTTTKVSEEEYLKALFISGDGSELIISQGELVGAYEQPINLALNLQKPYFSLNKVGTTNYVIPFYFIDTNNIKEIKINDTPLSDFFGNPNI
jgi:hypothetical protein